MKVVRADGHRQQQWALANPHTQTIARILSQHLDNDTTLLPTIAPVLQNIHGEVQDRLTQELASVRALYELVSSAEDHAIPAHVTELLEAIHELYHQPRSVLYANLKDQINSLRGAVLERLGLELIKYRYTGNDECANSRRFVDQSNRPITLQEVDIAAFSAEHRLVEGYECKIRAMALENHDCVDLAYLYKVAMAEDYHVQVGIVSLDSSRRIERRLGVLGAASCIRAFGIDTLVELQYSPFE